MFNSIHADGSSLKRGLHLCLWFSGHSLQGDSNRIKNISWAAKSSWSGKRARLQIHLGIHNKYIHYVTNGNCLLLFKPMSMTLHEISPCRKNALHMRARVPAMATNSTHSLFTLRKPHSLLRINGELGFHKTDYSLCPQGRGQDGTTTARWVSLCINPRINSDGSDGIRGSASPCSLHILHYNSRVYREMNMEMYTSTGMARAGCILLTLCTCWWEVCALWL